jgi:hypothetical protein
MNKNTKQPDADPEPVDAEGARRGAAKVRRNEGEEPADHV